MQTKLQRAQLKYFVVTWRLLCWKFVSDVLVSKVRAGERNDPPAATILASYLQSPLNKLSKSKDDCLDLKDGDEALEKGSVKEFLDCVMRTDLIVKLFKKMCARLLLEKLFQWQWWEMRQKKEEKNLNHNEWEVFERF